MHFCMKVLTNMEPTAAPHLLTGTSFCYLGSSRKVIDESLINAVRLSKAPEAKELLLEGAFPDASTKFGTTALWSAAYRGLTDVVQTLIERGADINLENQKGTTPLFVAAQTGHTEVVEILLEAGVQVDKRSKSGATPLMVAAQEDHVDVVRLLLEAGANVNISKKKSGQTALWSATFNGHEEVASLLLENGADSNIVDEVSGASPLYVAVRQNHLPLAKLMVENGAASNAGLRNGFTPLHVASAVASEAFVRLLLDNGANPMLKDDKNMSAIDILGKAREDVPSEEYQKILKMLQDAAEKFEDKTKVELESVDTGDDAPFPAIKGKLSGMPHATFVRRKREPESPSVTGAGASTPMIIIILVPILVGVVLIVGCALFANIVRLRKSMKADPQSQQQSEGGSSTRLFQPMLIHNVMSQPMRGGSPPPDDPISPHSSPVSFSGSSLGSQPPEMVPSDRILLEELGCSRFQAMGEESPGPSDVGQWMDIPSIENPVFDADAGPSVPIYHSDRPPNPVYGMDAAGPSGIPPPPARAREESEGDLAVPDVQKHQPTHARGPSLENVPVNITDSTPRNPDEIRGIYEMRCLMGRDEGSSGSSVASLVFKSASMRITTASDRDPGSPTRGVEDLDDSFS
ncbi:hypothetical protein BSKO_05539 [Bryopsis sp. KO-2023]|nr:hypothetical protein BSKO_05539 [Bryopsis sp. KO-2023]